MKKLTKEKLIKLVNYITDLGLKRFDIECENFVNLMIRFCDELDLRLHKLTLLKYEDWILDRVSDYWALAENSKIENNKEEEEEEFILPDTKRFDDDIDVIIVRKKSGKEFIYRLEKIVEVIEPVVEEQKPVEQKPTGATWKGLFTYVDNDKIFINRGKYRGCNVMDSKSLKAFFDNAIEFYGWILDCMRPSKIKKVMDSREKWELELNIKTLRELKNKIESSPLYQKFPYTFSKKRMGKGL